MIRSSGLATYPWDATTPEASLQRADETLPKLDSWRAKSALAVVPGAVCVQSRDYICSTSSTVRNRCGKVKPRRWSSTFWALSGVVTHRSRM